MKLTSELSRSTHASTLMPATTSAVSAAMSAQRAGSPAAMPATVAPTSIEIADVGPDRELARRAEQRVDQAPGQIAVDAVLRRQPGERGVGQRHRDRVGGERDARDGVAGQPRALVGGEPLRRRERRAPARCRCRRGGHPGGLAGEPSGVVEGRGEPPVDHPDHHDQDAGRPAEHQHAHRRLDRAEQAPCLGKHHVAIADGGVAREREVRGRLEVGQRADPHEEERPHDGFGEMQQQQRAHELGHEELRAEPARSITAPGPESDHAPARGHGADPVDDDGDRREAERAEDQLDHRCAAARGATLTGAARSRRPASVRPVAARPAARRSCRRARDTG